MNLVFLSGKIISDIEFKFIINSKKISIASFWIEIDSKLLEQGNESMHKNVRQNTEKNIIKINAYDEKADYIYRRLKLNDYICIYGKMEQNSVNVLTIEK